jgi:hypothetical protein
MSYPTPDELFSSLSAKTPGEGVDPDDAQIPDDQDGDLDDDPDDEDEDDDETAGDEGIDDPDVSCQSEFPESLNRLV